MRSIYPGSREPFSSARRFPWIPDIALQWQSDSGMTGFWQSDSGMTGFWQSDSGMTEQLAQQFRNDIPGSLKESRPRPNKPRPDKKQSIDRA